MNYSDKVIEISPLLQKILNHLVGELLEFSDEQTKTFGVHLKDSKL